MPNFISSSYGPGVSTTTAQGPTGMDVSPFLAALLAAETRTLSRRSVPSRSVPRGASGGGQRTVAAPRPSAPGGEGNRSSVLRTRILEAQAAKEKAEARALTGRVPTRMATVGGQTFATPDHLAMTGAQRQAFLPGNSSIQGRIGEMSPEDEDFLLRMRAGRMR